MKKTQYFNKIKKNITKIALVFILVIIFISLILFMASLASKKESSLQNIGRIFDTSNSNAHRKFKIESEKEYIYNIGEYQVNLDRHKHLVFNLSIKCKYNAFHTIIEKNILIQNAVLDSFSTYNSIGIPYTSYGHEYVKKKIKEHLIKVFQEPIIEEIYFNKFIIQKIPSL